MHLMHAQRAEEATFSEGFYNNLLLFLQVAELKMELKLRSLPVSGTKVDLIERLKLYQENSDLQAAVALEKTGVTAASQPENAKLSPPVSPIASRVSNLGIEDHSMADSPTKFTESVSTTPAVTSTQKTTQEECPTERDSEKDKRLHEKERQIEELMRKLEQEQKLVEELKMQLEVEKRSQQGDSPPHLSPLAPVQVKEENRSPSNCSASCTSPCLPVLVKKEEAEDKCHLAAQNQFVISHQTITQPDSHQPVEAGAQILLPASLPVTIQLPASSILLHTAVSSPAPGLILTPGQVPQKTEVSAASQHPLTKVRKHTNAYRGPSLYEASISCLLW